jgi:ectoine hydroxylase
MSSSTTTLTPGQVETFWRDGFILLDNVLDADLLATLRASLDRLLHRAQAEATQSPDFQLEKDAQHGSIRVIWNPVRYGEEWWRLVKHPIILGAVRNLAGAEVYLHQTSIFMKPPFEGSAKECHQDLEGGFLEPEETRRVMALGPGLRAADGPLITAQFYLDDSTETNGCLEFVSGSHTWGMCDKTTLETRFSEGQVVQGIVKAGGAALFHGLTFHYSSPNRSAYPRRAPIVRYYGPTTAYTWRQVPDTEGLGMRLV